MLPCQRHLFTLPDDLHYLNCAYMAPLARPVEEAGVAAVRRKRDPTQITSTDFFADADRARELFARLINAPDPRRVAVVPAASYGIATVVRNTPLERGQNVVVAAEQFPSNVHAWRTACRRADAELRTVGPPPGAAGRAAGWNARLLDALDERTAVVALGQVHWTDGTRFDLEALGRRAREVGAALVVDGTQSVGALPLDVQRLQPDAVVVAAYKWLMGPYGIGLAYYGPRYDGGEPLEETWLGREGSEDFRALTDYRDGYRPGVLRYDVGGSSNLHLMPALLAALEMVLQWGVEPIQEYCRSLAAPLVEQARALGFAAEEEVWRASHLFGLRAPADLDLARVQELLRQRRVAVSLRGSALRVSPHVYNDGRDTDALLAALREAR